MESEAILRVVREAVADTDWVEVTSSREGRYVSILIEGSQTTSARVKRHARLWSSGVEAFILELDDLYDRKDFDWEPEGQREIVWTLTRIAIEYLRGAGVQVTDRSRLGRRRHYLDIELDGGTYRFSRYT